MLIVINALILSVFFLSFFWHCYVWGFHCTAEVRELCFLSAPPDFGVKKYSCVCYDDKCKLDSSIS